MMSWRALAVCAVAALGCVLVGSAAAYDSSNDPKVVCFYDSKSQFRETQGRFDLNVSLEPALQTCTHLVYRSAGINPDTHEIVPLNEPHDTTRDHYRKVTDVKRRYPAVRVLLSVGGFDDDKASDKYLTTLESVTHRLAFINSAKTLIKTYGFDGLDLAWQFPTNKPKKIRGKVSSFFHGLKKKIVGESTVDEKAEEHREQFTALVREAKNLFKHDGYLLTYTLLPNVNSTVYVDVPAVMKEVDFANLMCFDYRTPKRNPKELDYPAPLYELIGRKPEENCDAEVRHWLAAGATARRLHLGLPTYGRTWKMTEESAISGVPPFETDGPGPAGPYTKHEGLWSYPEACARLANPQNLNFGQGTHLRKVGDPSKRYGAYAYRLPNGDGAEGVWVGYEDPDTAANKAAYAKAKGLGGVAIDDITLDDFRGLCAGTKYPITAAARRSL